MDKIDFCETYCPLGFREEFSTGDYQTDCACDEEDDEGQYCPFKSVNFDEVPEGIYNNVEYLKERIKTIDKNIK